MFVLCFGINVRTIFNPISLRARIPYAVSHLAVSDVGESLSTEVNCSGIDTVLNNLQVRIQQKKQNAILKTVPNEILNGFKSSTIFNLVSLRARNPYAVLTNVSECLRTEVSCSGIDTVLYNLQVRIRQKKQSVIVKTVPKKVLNGVKSSMVQPVSSRNDRLLNSLIADLLSKTDIEGAIKALTLYAQVNRYPSRKTFLELASSSSKDFNFEFLHVVQSTLKDASPKEFELQMKYQHYYAEALWKSGNHKKSIEIFEDLFEKYPKSKKVLTNMATLMAIDIVNKNLEEELNALVECAKRIYLKGIHKFVANVWFETFLSDSGAMNYISWNILDECPEMKPYITTKTDNILSVALESKNGDLFQRYIETVMRLNAETEYSKVLTAFLDFQCEKGDVSGAKETFEFAKSQNIYIKAMTLSRYFQLRTGKK